MQFSNKQQLDLKQRIAGFQGVRAKLPTAEIITCRTCTSGQTQELTCILCGEAKGLEAFGKTQRKNPDTAVTTSIPSVHYRPGTNAFNSVARSASTSKAKRNGHTSSGIPTTKTKTTATMVEAEPTPTPMSTNT